VFGVSIPFQQYQSKKVTVGTSMHCAQIRGSSSKYSKLGRLGWIYRLTSQDMRMSTQYNIDLGKYISKLLVDLYPSMRQDNRPRTISLLLFLNVWFRLETISSWICIVGPASGLFSRVVRPMIQRVSPFTSCWMKCTIPDNPFRLQNLVVSASPYLVHAFVMPWLYSLIE
jgi:hypothetical protein